MELRRLNGSKKRAYTSKNQHIDIFPKRAKMSILCFSFGKPARIAKARGTKARGTKAWRTKARSGSKLEVQINLAEKNRV